MFKKDSNIFIVFLLLSLSAFTQGSFSPLNADFVNAIKNLNDKSKENVDFGAIPYPIQLGYGAFVSKENKNLPSSFDLRGTGLIAPIKLQSDGGCWAYSTMSTLESRMLVLGKGSYNFSENNLQYCHGFFPDRYYNGNAWMSTAYFARQSGPLTQGVYPNASPPNLNCPTGTSPTILVRDSRYPIGDMNTIKQLVMDNGSVWSMIYYIISSFNDTDDTYFYNGTHEVNHVLNIVGWDDNKETLGGTGAWICQNTYGTGYGEDGFVYVSYNDSQFLKYNAYFPNYEPFHASSRVLLYDELGNYDSYGYGTETGYALVKYEIAEDLVIDKIGTYAMAYGSEISIELFSEFNAGVLSNKIGNVSQYTTEHPGLYSLNTDEPVFLSSGSNLFVKVKYLTPSYNYPIPVEMYIDTYSNPVIETGVCWMSGTGADGDWYALGDDVVGYKVDLCVNIYATDRNFVSVWNGFTWDNGIPDASFSAIIDGDYTSVGDIECHNLTINSGQSLNVSVNTGFTVNGSFLNNGTVNILSDETGIGSLITNGPVNNNGTFNMQRYVQKNAWHYISSPVMDLTASLFNGDYLQYWQESDTTWYEIITSSFPLQTGVGYALWTDENKTYTFSGVPKSGKQETLLSFTNTTAAEDGHEGANLMGNPYPSSLDWNTLDEVYGAVHYWDGAALSSWVAGGGINGGTQYISPGQGFFVVTDSPSSLLLNDDNRTHEGTEVFRKNENKLINGLVLASKSSDFVDEVLISFRADAEEGFEKSLDAYKFLSGNNSIPEIYTLTNGVKLGIDRRNESQLIQLGFNCKTSGNYNISVKESEGLAGIALEDSKHHVMHDLTKSKYVFDWDLGDSEKRFKLHINTTSVLDVNKTQVKSYYSEGVLKVPNNGITPYDDISVYDLSGRLIHQSNLIRGHLNSIPFSKKAGVYIVYLRGDGIAHMNKVVI